jgi:hypothetical protein
MYDPLLLGVFLHRPYQKVHGLNQAYHARADQIAPPNNLNIFADFQKSVRAVTQGAQNWFHPRAAGLSRAAGFRSQEYRRDAHHL